MALASVVGATALRLALDPWLGTRFPFATLFVAVLVSAWYGGFGPALCASVAGALAAISYLLPPRGGAWADDPENIGGLVFYFAVSLGIAAIGQAMRGAREQAEAQAAEAAIRREELRVTLESIGDAVITTDTEGRITSLNAVASALTGWPLDAARGRPLDAVFRIVNERTREPAPSPVAHALAAGTAVGLANHTLLIARDGREYSIDDSAAPIRDAHGTITGVVLVFRDASERRRVEQFQSLLANVVELSDDAIVTKDLDGIVTSWNAAAERVFGYSRAEMVGQPILRIVPPERADEETRILAAIARGERVESFESERVRKDGRRISVSLTISPIRSPTGVVIGASKIARDITDRRRADVERQKTLRELTTLYTVGQAVAGELDRERLLQTITDAATELSGARYGAFFYNVSEPGGGRYLLYTLSGAPRSAFAQLGAPRNTAVFAPTFAGDHVVRVADIRDDPRYGHNAPYHGMPPGHLPVTSYLAVPVLSRSGAVFGGLFLGHPEPGVFTADAERAVSALAAHAAIALENSRLFEEAELARLAAEQSSREKDNFLAMLGHELRNPLAAVRNALTASRLGSANTERALAIASHAAEHLTHLVDDLLDVTRVTQGRLKLRREPFRFADAIQRAIESVQPLFEERGVTLAIGLPPPTCEIVGDALRIEQVVGNLLTNAAKYSNPGGQVTVSAECSADSATLRITDTGIGIAPELLPRVFDLFVQGEQALDRARGGLGIGLTLVRRLVELHGGSVAAHSAGLGHGATFVVALPAREASGVSAPAPSGDRVPHHADVRVLIVEDNVEAAETLMILLEVFGCRVRIAGDGAAALAAARDEPPDVMLVDIGLPGMSGYELAATLRRDGALREVVLVALTGYGQDEDRERALAAGFDHHLVKPVELDRLKSVLASVGAMS